jgi:hypothetical protein
MWVLGLVVAAAVVSLVGNRTGSRLVSSLGFLVFLGAVFVYALWRRAVSKERAARVFDRESKTDETGTRTDQ